MRWMRPGGLTLAFLLSIPAASAAQDCGSVDNLLTNGCFTTEPTSGWTYLNGTVAATETTDCGTACNAARVTGNLGIRLRQCVGAPATGTYGFGFSAQADNADVDSCTASILTFTTTDCTGTPTEVATATITEFTETSYDSASANAVLSGVYSSVAYQINCPVFGGGSFTALLDDAFFGVGLVPVELQKFSID